MQSYLRENLSGNGSTAQSLATLQRDTDDQERLWHALCGVQVLGCRLDTKKLFRHRGEHVALPLYPWQRESHWHGTTNETLGALGLPLEHRAGTLLIEIPFAGTRRAASSRSPSLRPPGNLRTCG